MNYGIHRGVGIRTGCGVRDSVRSGRNARENSALDNTAWNRTLHCITQHGVSLRAVVIHFRVRLRGLFYTSESESALYITARIQTPCSVIHLRVWLSTLKSIAQHGVTLHSLFYTSESESELSSTDRCQTPCFTVGAQIITPFIGASMSEFYF